MPKIQFLLTPYFTFNFVSVPGDFQTLVKDYYTKKCRNCNKQLQKNAICLLCGEVVCFMPKDNCCSDLPELVNTVSMQFMMGGTSKEGELSYHARIHEAGCSLFIVPANAEVFFAD